MDVNLKLIIEIDCDPELAEDDAANLYVDNVCITAQVMKLCWLIKKTAHGIFVFCLKLISFGALSLAHSD
ncbi:unnamed protein product [Clavelina lepadiformis]|uniref:Uncharacterized protein n=1 Tax=Clavelina lepadiformis TaxID=159417 RepID=A0ABP0FTB7_CLALP